MAKTLVMDVTFVFGKKSHTVCNVSPQEAFNLLHMPAMGELIVSLTPNWVEVDGMPSLPESENKE